jgi:hypothetical protein
MFDYLPRYYSNIIEEHKQKEDHDRFDPGYNIQEQQEKVL